MACLALAACDAQAPEGKGSDEPQLARATSKLDQSAVCIDGDATCTPTGAHGKHGAFDCSACHKVAGRLSFDLNPPVYYGGVAPVFDATTKQCANVGCHSVPAGTYSYYFPGGDGEPALNTVPYGGGAAVTPSWYATSSGCGSCHGNPPSYQGNYYSWHSGYHGGQGPSGARNQCQFCHPDAAGDGGIGRTITNPALHRNGALNVQATFSSACFGCH